MITPLEAFKPHPFPSLTPTPHPTLAEALAASLARHESVRAS